MVSILTLVVNRLCGLVVPFSNYYFVDRVLVGHDLHVLYSLLMVIGAATLVQGGTSYLLNTELAKSQLRLIGRLRVRLRNHLLFVPVRFYDHHSGGSLVSRVMHDIDGIRNLFGEGLLEFVGEILTGTVALVVLLYLNWRLTLWILLGLAVFIAVLSRVLPQLRELFRTQARIAGDLSGQLSESISGIRTVKVYGGEWRESALFADGVEKHIISAIAAVVCSAKLGVCIAFTLGIVNLGILYFVGHAIIASQMTIGAYVTYALFVGIMSGPVLQIANMAPRIGEAMAGLHRAKEIFLHPRETEPLRHPVAPVGVRGHVIFDHVSFGYNPGVTVLSNITFEAVPGSVSAIVGASGAGKSTMMALLAGFEQPTRGTVCIDGVDLTRMDVTQYRKHLGIVFQDTFLFDGTLLENVMYGKASATQEEVRAACRAARVDELAEALPEGYRTRVGERGNRLSGGQKQRIAIARALLVEPKILILDEATSNLDAEAEAAVQQGLAVLMEGRTVFVIAHRLTSIIHANQILVIEKGVLVEYGRHADLLLRQGKYSSLYRAQIPSMRVPHLAPF